MIKTLAILSPNQNAYSETFIHAHKKLPFNIRFYYDGLFPTKLEGKKSLFIFNLFQKIKIRFDNRFNLSEHALLNSLKREKVDCVLAEYGTTAVATLKVVSHLQIPLVVHFHGSDASLKDVLKKNKEKYKLVFAYASRIIVVSKKMRSVLLTLGCPDNKLVLSYYGPDTSFVECQPDYKSQQFISVGRFVEKKAPYLTILSYKNMAADFPSSKLVMVGDGELLPVCQQLANALNLSNQVEFKKVQTPEQIKTLLNESIAFVQHSIVADNGDSEGTPVAILEAQAAALPVISTYHAGIPDVVINDETGFLVEEKNVDEMAKNMRRILNEKGLAKKLGEKGRERIKQHFSREKNLKQIEETILNSLLIVGNE
jgi:glycosyltransferase involved in cell wall biosynthesis